MTNVFWLFHRFDNKTIQYTEVCRTEELKTTYQLFISLRNLYYFRAFAVEGINCTVTTIDSSFEGKWFLIFILWLRTQRFAGLPCLAFFHSWRLFLSTNPAFLSWDLSREKTPKWTFIGVSVSRWTYFRQYFPSQLFIKLRLKDLPRMLWDEVMRQRS